MVPLSMYHSLAKERSLTKELHPLLLTHFSVYRVKVYLNEHPPWSEFRMEFEKHSLKRYAYLRKESSHNTSPKASLRRRMSLIRCIYRELHYAHGNLVPFRMLCAIRTRLRSRWWFCCMLLSVNWMASSHCEHDMGALLWLNAEIFKRASTPLFSGLVRCSAHGPLFRETMV